MMPIDRIEQLSAWLAETDIVELELRGPTGVVRLRQEVRGTSRRAVRENLIEPTSIVVRAPSAGVFLHRHPLHHTDLLDEGMTVSAGQLLGLLQIGSLLLPVLSPEAGMITSIRVPHGALAGYGTELIEIEQAE